LRLVISSLEQDTIEGESPVFGWVKLYERFLRVGQFCMANTLEQKFKSKEKTF